MLYVLHHSKHVFVYHLPIAAERLLYLSISIYNAVHLETQIQTLGINLQDFQKQQSQILKEYRAHFLNQGN